MNRTQRAAQLFEDMKFCPICGGEVRRFGGLSSKLKRCEDYHGVMSVTGLRHGSQLGILLLIDEEV